jgi:integrase
MEQQPFAPRPIQEIVRSYLDWSERVGRYTSSESCQERQRVLGWFVDAFGSCLARNLAPHQITDWILSHARWRSTSTLRAKFNIINRLFNWARRERRIPLNPLDACERFEEAERRPCLDDDLLNTLCVSADKDLALLLRFLRASAMRLGDAAEMRWEGVDLERRIARIDKHKARHRTKKAKLIYLSEPAVKLLEICRLLRPGGQGYVFTNKRGGPINRRCVGARLRRLKKRLGITSRPTCHGLRHQAATTALKNKAPLKAVSLWLGHSSTSITERFYVHLENDEEFIRSAADAAVRRPNGQPMNATLPRYGDVPASALTR